MKQLSLRMKIMASMMLLAVITLGVGLTGWWGTRQLSTQAGILAHESMPKVDALTDVRYGFEHLRVALSALTNPRLTQEEREFFEKQIADARETYSEALERFGEIKLDVNDARLAALLNEKVDAWRVVNEKALAAIGRIDATGIHNPAELLASVQDFRSDHFELLNKVGIFVIGGADPGRVDDATACDLGRWLATARYNNSTLQTNINELREHHAAFHQSLAEAVALARANQSEEAGRALRERAAVAADEVFEHLEIVISEADKADALLEEYETLIFDEGRVALNETLAVLTDLLADVDSDAAEVMAEVDRLSARMTALTLIAGALGLVVAILLGYGVSTAITRPVRRIIDGLRSGAEQVSSSAAQVSQASQQLAEGASEQASSIEETSSSLEEMAAMTRQNADNSRQANQMAQQAQSAAAVSREAMQRMNEAITRIKASSDETSKIIKTIDEIAFQTNLLALNAAVEAARAGEAGKGFAVVAEEVRNLARRSAEAARTTSELIEGAAEHANNGVAVSREVEEVLDQIAAKVAQVTQLINEVSAASEEQSRGIEQINIAVSQMDKVTQANAGNAEESASASEEMSAQAREMQEIVQSLVKLIEGGSDVQIAEASRQAGLSRLVRPTRRADEYVRAASTTRRTERPTERKPVTVERPEQVIPLDDSEFGDF